MGTRRRQIFDFGAFEIWGLWSELLVGGGVCVRNPEAARQYIW